MGHVQYIMKMTSQNEKPRQNKTTKKKIICQHNKTEENDKNNKIAVKLTFQSVQHNLLLFTSVIYLLLGFGTHFIVKYSVVRKKSITRELEMRLRYQSRNLKVQFQGRIISTKYCSIVVQCTSNFLHKTSFDIKDPSTSSTPESCKHKNRIKKQKHT